MNLETKILSMFIAPLTQTRSVLGITVVESFPGLDKFSRNGLPLMYHSSKDLITTVRAPQAIAHRGPT